MSRLKYLPMRGLLSYGLMFCIHPLTFWWTLNVHLFINDRVPGALCLTLTSQDYSGNGSKAHRRQRQPAPTSPIYTALS